MYRFGVPEIVDIPSMHIPELPYSFQRTDTLTLFVAHSEDSSSLYTGKHAQQCRYCIAELHHSIELHALEVWFIR